MQIPMRNQITIPSILKMLSKLNLIKEYKNKFSKKYHVNQKIQRFLCLFSRFTCVYKIAATDM